LITTSDKKKLEIFGLFLDYLKNILRLETLQKPPQVGVLEFGEEGPRTPDLLCERPDQLGIYSLYTLYMGFQV